MTPARGLERSGPVEVQQVVVWAPCLGMEPVVVGDARGFVIGQAIVLAIAVAVFGLMLLLQWSNWSAFDNVQVRP